MAVHTSPVVLNNYGDNINLTLDPERGRHASEAELKYILFWNEAYVSTISTHIYNIYNIYTDTAARSTTSGLGGSHSTTTCAPRPGAWPPTTGNTIL